MESKIYRIEGGKAMKKRYKKPQIKRVELTPEEAVLSGCKTATGGARKAGRCVSKSTCDNLAVAS